MVLDNNQDKKSEQLEQVSNDEISLVGGGKKIFGKIQSGKITPCLVAYGAPKPPIPKPSVPVPSLPTLPEQDKNSVVDSITGIEDTKKEQKTEE